MASEEATKEAYHKQLTEYKAMQQSFEESSTNSLANHFIKAENKYYAPEIIKSPQEYLNVVKEHYFDYLDLTSEVLNNSSLISERIIDYIFYLNTSEDIEMQSKLYRASVNEVVARFEGYDQLKAMLVTTILQAFTQLENLSMVDYIIENHYKSLPDDLKDEEMLTDLNHRMRLAVGNVAPDFDFSIRGEPMALHSLKGAENYVIVFWSSTCDHCLEEMPKLHSFTRGKDQIEVIAIALESDTTTYKQYTDKLTGWIHVIGLGKWNNTIARLYEVNATPTYFVLNREKKIIAKPEFFQDVQWFFEH
jgi:thiol-disulfide isomerase/thioredoxin